MDLGNIYIADLSGSNFLTNLPFEEFVTVRPEALLPQRQGEGSIVPLLLKYLIKENYNIVYLPRVDSDIKYQKDWTYSSQKGIKWINLCYYSTAILTGSGTLAREAACMGTPSISFFPNKLLSVDQSLVNQGKIFHSRDPVEIVDYIESHSKNDFDRNIEQCKLIKKDVISITKKILEIINK